MPYRVNNTFTPASPFGAPIQALTRAMFSGLTPAEEEAKRAAAEAHRAQGEHYRAQNAKLGVETDALRQAATRAQDPVANFVNNVFGAERGAEVTNFQRGVKTDQYRGSDGEDGPATMMAPAARPGWLSPKDEAALNEQARIIAIANNLTGKTSGNGYDDIAKAIRTGAAQDAIIGGASATPYGKAFAATAGHAPFSQNAEGSVLNNLEGTVDQSNPLAIAVQNLKKEQAGKETAHAGAYRAAANASNASAGEHTAGRDLKRAQAGEIGRLVEVVDPNTGQKFMVPEGKAGLSVLGRENKKELQDNAAANKPPGAKATRMINPAQVELEVNRALGVSMDKTTGKPLEGSELPLAPALLARVKQRAAEIYGSSNSGNLTDAVNQAVAEAGDLVPETTPGRIYGTNPTGRRTSASTPAPASAPNPNARQVAPVKITGDADYAKLPSGAQYIAPDGTTRTKK